MTHPKIFGSADAPAGWLACLVRCEVVDAAHPQADQLAGAMAKLANDERAMTTPHYFPGWSHQRIADHWRTSAKAVESRLARLRKRLRQHLCP